jgi:hypothetical protein
MLRLTDGSRRIKEAVCRQIFGLNSSTTTSVSDSVCVSHVFTFLIIFMMQYLPHDPVRSERLAVIVLKTKTLTSLHKKVTMRVSVVRPDQICHRYVTM